VGWLGQFPRCALSHRSPHIGRPRTTAPAERMACLSSNHKGTHDSASGTHGLDILRLARHNHTASYGATCLSAERLLPWVRLTRHLKTHGRPTQSRGAVKTPPWQCPHCPWRGGLSSQNWHWYGKANKHLCPNPPPRRWERYLDEADDNQDDNNDVTDGSSQ